MAGDWTQSSLNAMTADALRELCRDCKLSSSGRKSELVARLLQHKQSRGVAGTIASRKGVSEIEVTICRSARCCINVLDIYLGYSKTKS